MSELEVARLLVSLVRCRGHCPLEVFQRWMGPSRTERAAVAAGIQKAIATGQVELSKDGKYLLPVGVQVVSPTDKSLVLDWWARLTSTQYSDFNELGINKLREVYTDDL